MSVVVGLSGLFWLLSFAAGMTWAADEIESRGRTSWPFVVGCLIWAAWSYSAAWSCASLAGWFPSHS